MRFGSRGSILFGQTLGTNRSGNGLRQLVFVFAVGGVAALTTVIACGPGSGGGSGGGGSDATTDAVTGPGSPAVFVIDSTGTLFSFDSQGNSLASVALPGPIGALNGGGITLKSALEEGVGGSGSTSPTLFVTNGAPANNVSAYTVAGLVPTTTVTGVPESALFPNLNAPRGIAYGDGIFFVASRGSSDGGVMTGGGGSGGCLFGDYVQGICTYTQQGAPLGASHEYCSVDANQTGCPTNGASGVAWDPDDFTIWVADYLGAPQTGGPQYGVTEYVTNSQLGANAQTFDYATQFAPTQPAQEPYAITVCPKSATGGTTLIVVGFTGDGQGAIQSVQPFTTSGAPVGPPLTGDLGGLSALSCDAYGNVYIADTMGLFRNKVTSAGFTPGQNASLASPGFSGLRPPIYGVFAGPVPATGSTPDGGRSDGGGGGDGGISDAALHADGAVPGTPIPADVDGGPQAFCEQSEPQDTPPTETWVAAPNPYGPGYFCCGTNYGGDICPPSMETTIIICYDYAQNVVSEYYDDDSLDAGQVGGLDPSGGALSNCSSEPPGYLVPQPDWRDGDDATDYCAAHPNSTWCNCHCGSMNFAPPNPYGPF